MVDACRSGALTRIKGGRSGPAFALDVGERLSGEGLAYLTSSSGNEDAQESDEIRGSFFTHHFTSALLGAGDVDADGKVTLEEAYRYAYDATLRSTSRTWAGLQHPAFRYDLRGEGKLALTSLIGVRSARATLAFPGGRTYLVMEGSASGPVVAEIGAPDRARRISVRAGRYFIRGRMADAMLEGELNVPAGVDTQVADDALHRTEYARLVRKGSSDVHVSHGALAGYSFRTPFKNASTLCHGAFAGYAAHWRALEVTARVDGCLATAQNDTLRSRDADLGAEVRVAHAWDLPIVTLTVGIGAGAAWLHQTFTTAGNAPTRDTPAGRFGVSAGLSVPLFAGMSLLTESAAMTYVYGQTSGSQSSVGPWFSFRQTMGVEKEF
jgi:hypothetical protein